MAAQAANDTWLRVIIDGVPRLGRLSLLHSAEPDAQGRAVVNLDDGHGERLRVTLDNTYVALEEAVQRAAKLVRVD